MNHFLRISTPFALLVMLSVGLAACDSNDDDGGSNVSFEADMATMNTNVSAALATAFQVGFTPGKRQQPTGNCSQSGTVAVTANTSTSGFDFDIDFTNCNGIDGTLDMTGTVTGAGYTSTIDGQLRERCTITYDDFQQATSANGQSLTLNGSYSATCDGVSRTCSFSNDTVDPNTGASFYASRCN